VDISKMIAELNVGRENLGAAIKVFEQLAMGRPPAWMSAMKAEKRLGRPPGSKKKPKEE
jgi:hypothetical protein